MFHFSRRTKIFLIVIASIVAVFLGNRLLDSKNSVPGEFTEARLQGAIISQNIVELSRKSTADLEAINKLDSEKNFGQALDLTLKVIQQSREIREQAVKLSDQVSKMTQALSGIKSFEARQAALEAIASQLAIISRLINYSDYLGQLLTILQARFVGQPGDHRVATIIDQTNAEVNAINNFNNQATQAMARFDSIVDSR